MKRLASLLLTVILCLPALGQAAYPIKTIFKGDSVVILTFEQFKQINGTLSSQKKKLKSVELNSIDLKRELAESRAETARIKALFAKDTALHAAMLDSASRAGDARRKTELNAATSKIKLMDDWLLETAVGNAYLYFDWKDSTVKAVDLTLYESEFNHDVGTLSLIRRGSNSDYAEFRKRLWQYPESPDQEWSKVNSPEMRPIIYPYLHKIRVKNAFLGEFMKNPYVK